MSSKSLFELATQDPIELNSLVLKSKLAALIRILVKEKNLSQTKTAEILLTTQPRVSNLLNGQVNKFSIDFLLVSLLRLGYKADFDYDPTDLDEPLRISMKKAVL
jgi:predicted XRE-type DNA-binding protein